METQLTDQEQVEAIKKWWKDNGRSVVVGILLGVSVVGGYRYWNYQQDQAAKAASEMYSKLTEAMNVGNSSGVLDQGAVIVAEHPGTAYAVLASFAMAKARVEANDLDAAQQQLRWALDNAGSDEFKHIARVRLARVLLAKGAANEALQLVTDIPAGSFAPAYEEIKGDAYLQLGNPADARSAYQVALTGAVGNTRELIQLKLDDLGAVPSDSPVKAE